jgi:hypothetical protein
MNNHMDYLSQVAVEDISCLRVAEQNYGSSWKKRGGVGAFMMLARKWDRLENALSPRDGATGQASAYEEVASWDILQALKHDTREEGIIDDIRDLRRYLLLVEAEYLANNESTPDEDPTSPPPDHPMMFQRHNSDDFVPANVLPVETTPNHRPQQKFQVGLTKYEYDELEMKYILHGSMIGAPIHSLYFLVNSADNKQVNSAHYAIMKPDYVEEYVK